jgi:hypothetical protein
MPEPIFLQLVEKMLGTPGLEAHISKSMAEKLRVLLSKDKLPTKNELIALLMEPDVENRVDQGK